MVTFQRVSFAEMISRMMQSAIEYRKFVGHMISPDDAYRLQTQILTFELRFSRQCDNASKLSDYLKNISVIKQVWFPGLKIIRHIILQRGFLAVKDMVA